MDKYNVQKGFVCLWLWEIWKAAVEYSCEREPQNSKDTYAVVVKRVEQPTTVRLLQRK